ncbi:MAG: tautomerase family protein [Candidatus Glassbacteria bacterium]|nr:tautomerase family protein [Candidatus Glassbacteria bacterium]
MPVVTVQGPPIKEVEVKRSFVKELTAAASRAYGLDEDSIIVLIKENPPENVGVGGRLILDKNREKK